MRSLQDIKEKLSLHKKGLFSDYPIKSLAIFGSYARMEQSQNSDVDVLVDFSGKIGVRFIDLADDLEKILGIRVDLVSRRGIAKKYLESIDNDLIYV